MSILETSRKMTIREQTAYDLGFHEGRNAAIVHGRWRLETDEEEPNPMFKLVVCSACNDKANGTYNYCPNCGAKMDAKE